MLVRCGCQRLQLPPARIAEAGLGGSVGFAVADARGGQVLEGIEAGRALPPASVAKAITALYALEALGPGHRFRTRLIGTGPLRNGRLEGDLILAGGGDPTLDTDDLAGLAAGLKAAGVVEIRGRFRFYDRSLPFIREIDPAQPPHVGYNPAVSGLNLNYNRVYFGWKRGEGGYEVAMDARSESVRPAVTVARMRVAERAAPVYTYADRDGVDDWTVAAPALGAEGSRWLPVRRPAEYAAEVFQILARSHGIQLSAPQPLRGQPEGTLLAEHVSDELGTMLAEMLRWSTNLTAEAIGLAASEQLGARPASLPVSGARMGDWLKARANVNGVRFVDHSGLGPESRISAADMVRALVGSGPDGTLRRMLKRIDMKDERGRVLRDHPARVVGKTGTLNFVSALSGYVQTPSARVLAFAVFAADLDRRRALGEDEVERPPGGRAWTLRARALQQKLIERWVERYA